LEKKILQSLIAPFSGLIQENQCTTFSTFQDSHRIIAGKKQLIKGAESVDCQHIARYEMLPVTFGKEIGENKLIHVENKPRYLIVHPGREN